MDLDKVPFRVVDCDCKKFRPHGEAHGYNYHQCRCDPCRDAYRTYNKRRLNEIRKGNLIRVSPQKAQNYMALLRERGMTYNQLEKATGLSRATVTSLINGKPAYLKKSTEDRLLAIPLPSRDQYEIKQ